MFNADELRKAFLDEIEAAKSEMQLSDVWKKYLGKGGSVQKLMNGIKEVAKEEKRVLDPLELELQKSVSCSVGAGMEP